jgi:hypothetical protein
MKQYDCTKSDVGRIDKFFGAPAITRNWNTIVAVVRILKAQKNKPADYTH